LKAEDCPASDVVGGAPGKKPKSRTVRENLPLEGYLAAEAKAGKTRGTKKIVRGEKIRHTGNIEKRSRGEGPPRQTANV